MWASILVIILYTIKFGLLLARDSQAEKGKGVKYFSSFLVYVSTMSLLYFAGTFDNIIK